MGLISSTALQVTVIRGQISLAAFVSVLSLSCPHPLLETDFHLLTPPVIVTLCRQSMAGLALEFYLI